MYRQVLENEDLKIKIEDLKRRLGDKEKEQTRLEDKWRDIDSGSGSYDSKIS